MLELVVFVCGLFSLEPPTETGQVLQCFFLNLFISVPSVSKTFFLKDVFLLILPCLTVTVTKFKQYSVSAEPSP